MAISIQQWLNTTSLSTADARALAVVLKGLVDDIAAVKADVVIVAAQLDDDATVTDTDYEASLVSDPTVTD